jgi:hypothetical protein
VQVGLIVEGTTDYEILRALTRSRHPAAEVALIPPKEDRTRHEQATGWSGVQKHLRSKGHALGILRQYGGRCMESKETAFYREEFAPALTERWEQVVGTGIESARKFEEVLVQLSQTCGEV